MDSSVAPKRVELSPKEFMDCYTKWSFFKAPGTPATFGFYTAEDELSSYRVQKAKALCSMPDNENIIFLYDKTVLGSCDYCTVFGRFGIYSRDQKNYPNNTKNSFISWNQFFSSGLLSRDGDSLYLDGEYFVNGFVSSKHLFTLLDQLRKMMKVRPPYCFLPPRYSIPKKEVTLTLEEGRLLWRAAFKGKKKEKDAQLKNQCEDFLASEEYLFHLEKKQFIYIFSSHGVHILAPSKKLRGGTLQDRRQTTISWRSFAKAQTLLHSKKRIFLQDKELSVYHKKFFAALLTGHAFVLQKFATSQQTPPGYEIVSKLREVEIATTSAAAALLASTFRNSLFALPPCYSSDSKIKSLLSLLSRPKERSSEFVSVRCASETVVEHFDSDRHNKSTSKGGSHIFVNSRAAVHATQQRKSQSFVLTNTPPVKKRLLQIEIPCSPEATITTTSATSIITTTTTTTTTTATLSRSLPTITTTSATSIITTTTTTTTTTATLSRSLPTMKTSLSEGNQVSPVVHESFINFHIDNSPPNVVLPDSQLGASLSVPSIPPVPSVFGLSSISTPVHQFQSPFYLPSSSPLSVSPSHLPHHQLGRVHATSHLPFILKTQAALTQTQTQTISFGSPCSSSFFDPFWNPVTGGPLAYSTPPPYIN